MQLDHDPDWRPDHVPRGAQLWGKYLNGDPSAPALAAALAHYEQHLPPAYRPIYGYFHQRMQGRPFQRLLLANVLEHTRTEQQTVFVAQAPTAAGKSLALLAEAFVGKGLASFRTAPHGPCRYRVLILKPDCTIRDQTARDCDRLCTDLAALVPVPHAGFNFVSVAAVPNQDGQGQAPAYEVRDPVLGGAPHPRLAAADIVVCNYHRLTDGALQCFPADFHL